MLGIIVRESIKLVKPWLNETTCIGCHQASIHLICNYCQQEFLKLKLENYCRLCGENHLKKEQAVCQNCKLNPPPWDRIFIGFSYEGLMQQFFREFKFQANFKAGKALSEQLNLTLKPYDFNQCKLIIPVPIHKWRHISRGFNQSHYLAKNISQFLNIPINTKIAKRPKKTKAQSLLKATERQKNLVDAFSIDDHLKLENIIIIDDVIITGNTLRTFCRALKDKGVNQITVIVLAKAKLKS